MVLDQSPRSVIFGPALAVQRAYIKKSSGSRFGLLVPEAFVRGIRDLGYRSNADAFAELIDNALQAHASRIDVVFGYDGTTSNKKPVQLAVVDNGHGMEPDMIRMAVMWGGTHRENDRSGFGRYGYGLPCSSLSLGRRFTVISKVGGGALHAVCLDLDEIAAGDYTDAQGNIVVPGASTATLPSFVSDYIAENHPEGWESGTVIYIENLDRLEWLTSRGLRQNVRRQFGVTYHKILGEAEIFVDGEYVDPIDPLFLTPKFHLHDLDEERAQGLTPVKVEVRDPASGGYLGTITLRYVWLPPSFGSVDKSRDAVGINANARFSILKEYHGLIFSRNGRLIDVQTRTPWTTFINNDRYIKVEIEFSATLDEAFGVTTAKQQVTVSPVIWDILQQAGLPKAIEQLRKKVKEAKASPPCGDEPRVLKHKFSAASAIGDGKLNRQTAPIRRGFPYLVVVEKAPRQPFFRVEGHEGAWTLYLNTMHRFYREVYDGPASTPELKTSLEVLLFSSESQISLINQEDKENQNMKLSLWSDRLDAVLGILSDHLKTDGGKDY